MTSSSHLRIDILCFQDTILVLVMDHTLISYTKTCTHLNGLCTQHECSRHSTAIPNTSGCDHRNLYCINHLWNQRHGCCLTDVSTGFSSLCNNCVCAHTLHPFCESYRCNYRDHLDTCSFPLCHIFLRVSCSGRNRCDLLLCHKLCDIFCKRTHQHDIYTKRLVRQFSCLVDVISDHICRCISCTDEAEPACVGYCSCQVRFSNPGHTTLNDRFFNSQKFCYSRLHICFAPPVLTLLHLWISDNP